MEILNLQQNLFMETDIKEKVLYGYKRGEYKDAINYKE